MVKDERFGAMLIDMQDYYIEGKINPLETKLLVNSQLDVIRNCAKHDIPLLTVTYGKQSFMAKLMKAAKKVPRHAHVVKCDKDAFTNLDTITRLKEWDVSSLCMMGIYASACVYESAKSAVKHGYEVYSACPLIADQDCYKFELPNPKWFMENGKFFQDYEDLISRMVL